MRHRLTPPPGILKRIGRSTAMPDGVGMSGASVLLYKGCVLKHTRELRELRRERQMMAWLQHRLPVPRLLHYEEDASGGWLLFEQLGLQPDWDKIRYYILLDELF